MQIVVMKQYMNKYRYLTYKTIEFLLLRIERIGNEPKNRKR